MFLTVVRTVYGNSEVLSFGGWYASGSGLSPLLFAIVMLAISMEFRIGLPWNLLYDLVVIADCEEK